MASLTIDKIEKRYGNVEILKRIDIGIGNGEFLVLVGPSGCGKSTLLSLIAGLETVSDGEIRIDNLPLYSQDYDQSYPPEALALKDAIAKSDAILFVTPEYNHGVPAAMKNALDVLWSEWGNKTVGFVAYGFDGGTRSVEQWRMIVAAAFMIAVRPQVALQNFADFDGNDFTPLDRRERELVRGHTEYRFTGWITVTATTRDDLEAACALVEQAAVRSALEVRRIYGEVDQAFLRAGLPLTQGVTP